jgi:hypothetical protein
MARNNSIFPLGAGPNQRTSTFLVGKASKFMPETIRRPGYYTSTKHLRDEVTPEEAFVSSFDNQVVPNILPSLGQIESPDSNISYLTTELNNILMTEDDNNIILE